MNILHICNDFCGSKVHSCLYKELDNHGINQTIYSYMNSNKKNGNNCFDSHNTNFVYSPILNKVNRIFYPYKEYVVYMDILSKIQYIDKFDIIHATTLYSDGGIAYRLKKKFGIPYIVAVRSSDTKAFMKVPFYWKYGKEILENASKIVFISNPIKNDFLRDYRVRKILPKIESKFVTRYNGVNSFWINNVISDSRSVDNHNICYVGTLIKRKNVLKLIEAVVRLSYDYPDIKLIIIGKGGKDENKVKEISDNNKHIEYVGSVSEKKELIKFYRKCSVFAMPSVSETFGLVYIEALSQNCTLLYTKNDGIDGNINGNIGEAIIPTIDNIAIAIKQIFDNPQSYIGNNQIDFSIFDWNNISQMYIDDYEDIIAR